MQKLICTVLSALLLFSLTACSGGEDATTAATEGAPSLKVGYSKVSIVPSAPCPFPAPTSPPTMLFTRTYF